ncbi:hypothetical protein BEWA_025810 [Theileria equi strain WA]|uniref:Uncharacterized protein n=1 Tax=Theileria equi strain WA TaxID=1537102 RepID=L0AVV2_THEEQ|nr:hypothetical protein BEWA_025810 [Theileria equi strain WA]AFZ79732.1 hypothetical protein BEWA_025810 [Theileria equi strain WA]|eukprot:XP_004829398.1 hypothetical protein BEWA_025810 [Theileria equi strain WA]
MSGMLTLKIDGKCDGQCTCTGSSNIPNLKAKKVTDIGGVTNFTKYTHSVPGGGTFTLSGQLSNGGKIGSGNNMEYVQSIAVYFWNGNPSDPILLGIKRTGDNGNITTSYYGKNNPGSNDWNVPLDGMDELQALDDQNCKHNNVIPLNIEGSQSISLPKESNSECIQNRRIMSTRSPDSPPGSDYTVKAQKITDIDGRDSNGTKISRVTYNGNPVEITLPKGYEVSKIRIFSYPGGTGASVPLMFELKSTGGGNSTFYTTKNQKGTSWTEADNGNSFYGKGNPTPLPALAERLDKVLCSQGYVTLNLSFKNSEEHQRGGAYCCDEHNKKKVTVNKDSVKSSQGITFYKHDVDYESKVAGIYYTVGGERKRIRIPNLENSGDGSVKFYTFYSNNGSKEPRLIYLDSTGQPNAKGWFQPSNSPSNDTWEPFQDIPKEITPENIGKDKTGDSNSKKHVEELKCIIYGICTLHPHNPLLSNLDLINLLDIKVELVPVLLLLLAKLTFKNLIEMDLMVEDLLKD